MRYVAEQHVREDCRRIPTIADWLKALPIEPWMVNGVILPDQEFDADQTDIAAWRREVAVGNTILGLTDWRLRHAMRPDAA